MINMKIVDIEITSVNLFIKFYLQFHQVGRTVKKGRVSGHSFGH